MSSSNDIFLQLQSMLSNYLRVPAEQIRKESHFVNDFGQDSLAMAELLWTLEEDFQVKIPEGEVMNTVGRVLEFLEQQSEQAQHGSV